MFTKEYFFEYRLGLDMFDICLPEHFPQKNYNSFDSYDPEDIVREISKLYISNGPKKIFFHNFSEGFTINKIQYIDKVARMLENNHKIPHGNLFLSVGVLPVKENFLNYEKICSRYNLTKLNLVISNALEQGCSMFFKNSKVPFNSNINKKNKKFISMNGVPRAHRLYFTMLMIEKNLLDLGHYSFYRLNGSSFKVDIANIRNYIPKYIDEIHEKCSEIFVNTYHKFPMYLSKKTDTDHTWFKEEDFELFNDARFNIVQETNFFDKEHGGECFNYADMQMVSEKTFRSFGYSMPFVMLNRPFVLRELRNYGYQTFHPFIDETYDTIQDDKDRLITVLNEVERLCNLSDSEWQDIYINLLPRIKHNYDKLLSTQNLILTNLK